MKKSSAWCMLVPGLVILFLFLMIPLLRVLVPSVFTGDYPFSAYVDFFKDEYYRKIFLRTVKIAVITTFVCMVGGIPTAYFISRCDKKWRGLLLSASIFPMMTNSVIRSFAWINILGSNGIINKAMIAMGLIEKPMKLLYTDFSIIIGSVYLFLPLMIVTVAGVMENIDDDMMAELQEIKENVTVHQTVLVVDAMTGQDAVNVAKMFDEKVGIDGVILTKLDGDTRGGAALSIRAVTGKPILYVGMGEKLSDLEQFYPDRMASRILGMGDVLTLIEKAQADIDEEQAKRIEQKMRKNEFDFEMYLESMSQMKKMGGLSSILGMMPGLGMGMGKGKMPEIDQEAAEKNMARTEAIIYSMTPEERRNPSLMNPSRKNRIAKGAGVDIAEVNRLVKQFEQMKKMMKQMPGMMKKGKRGMFKGLPF